jgi:hypothetical protein
MNTAIIVVVSAGAALALALFIRDILIWSYKEGYERGRKDAEEAWAKLGCEVDQARQQIWREEGMNQRGDAA